MHSHSRVFIHFRDSVWRSTMATLNGSLCNHLNAPHHPLTSLYCCSLHLWDPSAEEDCGRYTQMCWAGMGVIKLHPLNILNKFYNRLPHTKTFIAAYHFTLQPDPSYPPILLYKHPQSQSTKYCNFSPWKKIPPSLSHVPFSFTQFFSLCVIEWFLGVFFTFVFNCWKIIHHISRRQRWKNNKRGGRREIQERDQTNRRKCHETSIKCFGLVSMMKCCQRLKENSHKKWKRWINILMKQRDKWKWQNNPLISKSQREQRKSSHERFS